MLKKAPHVLMIVACVAVAAACSSSEGACAAVSADLPATAQAGAAIDVDLANLFATCNDQGEGANQAVDDVEVQLVSGGATKTVVATGRSPVAEDGTAVVSLTLPDDASGVLTLEYQGSALGTVSVTG